MQATRRGDRAQIMKRVGAVERQVCTCAGVDALRCYAMAAVSLAPEWVRGQVDGEDA